MPRQSSTSIPLICNLCPKNPKFSDVSHLLTHISSKSHLSNRFKLQIRSQAEQEAKNKLAEFDRWYTNNGLDVLLSERLAAKEQKKTTRRPRIPNVAAKPELISDDLDFKPKNLLELPITATPLYHPPVPRMYTWSTDSFAAAFTLPPPISPWKEEACYETPTTKRNIPNFSQRMSPTVSSTDHGPTPVKPEENGFESATDNSKLKGVYWPGMHLFDSATAEMKRMRNQKKDGTALRQMKMSSAEVEPTEWIFNPDGEFRRARDIFDESPENSPTKSVIAPSPKKRRTRKTALTEISANIPGSSRQAAKQPAKKAGYKRRTSTNDTEKTAPKNMPKPNHLSVLTSRFEPTIEEHEEFRLTMEDLGKSRRLTVFRDAEVDSPGRTESPLEDHRFDFSNVPLEPKSKSVQAIPNSPTPIFRHFPARLAVKENMGSDRMHQRLMSTVTGEWNPELIHNDCFNPLYTSHAHSFTYRDHETYRSDFKPSSSSFGSDFKPLMMTNSFQMMEPRGFFSPPGRDNNDDSMHFER